MHYLFFYINHIPFVLFCQYYTALPDDIICQRTAIWCIFKKAYKQWKIG